MLGSESSAARHTVSGLHTGGPPHSPSGESWVSRSFPSDLGCKAAVETSWCCWAG